jgi:hypothetical protein
MRVVPAVVRGQHSGWARRYLLITVDSNVVDGVVDVIVDVIGVVGIVVRMIADGIIIIAAAAAAAFLCCCLRATIAPQRASDFCRVRRLC